MRAPIASFGMRLLGTGSADKRDVDRALAIFIRNTSALLRTKTNEIRAKIANPITPEGNFYFAALYRSELLIGFSMFGYYPRTKLIVVDHMVIDSDHRGASAFYVFVQLLHDTVQKLDVEVDFTAVELERANDYGSDQTGGEELIRLLGQVGFGEVHVEYFLPNTEPRNYEARYNGVLMLRGTQKLYRIRREDLLEICSTIFFDHYFPWYSDFFGEKTDSYKDYLGTLFRELSKRLENTPVVTINGPEKDVLIGPSVVPPNKSPEVSAAIYLGLFVASAVTLTGILQFLKVPANVEIPLLVALIVVFAGVVAISRGRAFEVFETAIRSMRGGRQKSRYQLPDDQAKKAGKLGRARRIAPKGSAGGSVGK